MMAEQQIPSASMSHLSIGEVLALLLEEFPDVTISKIRFLESQGLIDPERTPSGYRKFYDDDVELLRCILREQRENYLPLRVIKDRLDSGEIDSTHAGESSVVEREAPAEAFLTDVPPTDEPTAKTPPTPVPPTPTPTIPAPGLLPGVVLTKAELCSMAGLDAAEFENLESYGLITSLRGSTGMYDEGALAIARVSKQFLDAGADARHLRGWKVAADREVGLFEQMIQPLLRQRNPQATSQARQHLVDLDQLGGELRDALMQAAMRQHFED
jgi:DNA-binding transcriptional MerR regulator